MKKEYDEKSIDSILEFSRKLVNKSVGSISKVKLESVSGNKGKIGQFVEKNFFGIETNSLQEPDFKEAGLELKVTPIKMNKKGLYSSKERLSLTMINYIKDNNVKFTDSNVFKKISNILIIAYLYDDKKDKSDFIFIDVFHYTIPKEDLPTIKEDYNIVMKYIANGNAHKLSESQTTYLSASTKSQNKSNKTKQPNSDILAKPRAWSFKPSYMNYYYRKNSEKMGGSNLITDESLTLNKTIDKIITKYIGKTDIELLELFEITNKSKQNYQIITSNIFGIKGTNLDSINEFKKAGIKVKSIRVCKKGKLKQDLSFEKINFIELEEEKIFEESKINSIFCETTYLLIFYKEISKGVHALHSYKKWSITEEQKKLIKEYWIDLKEVISKEIQIVPHQEKSRVKYKYPDFPNSSTKNLFHCRTKGMGKGNSSTYTKLPKCCTVRVKERSFAGTADKEKLLPLGNLPPEGTIHSMCTFVHKSVIENFFNDN